MPKFEVDGKSIAFTVRGFRGSRARIRKASVVATGLAGARLLAAVRANVSVPPIGGSPRSHRQALAALGHPYAARNGSIQISPSGGFPGFGRPKLLVHTVSGALLSSISGRLSSTGSLRYQVTADPNKAPHLRYVIRGTQVMLPRDILAATLFDPAVIAEARKSIIFVLGRVFRTQARIRFT